MTFRNPYFVRYAGEYYGEQVTPDCETCGRDQYACECEPETGYAYPLPTMTHEEALAKIKAALFPHILELEARRNSDGSYSVEM